MINPIHKILNNLIGIWWTFIGSLCLSSGIFALLWPLIKQLNIFATTPFIANGPLDFVVIFGIIFFGFFCMSWAGAMISQPLEWGAFVGAIVRVMWTLNLLAAGFIFYQQPTVLLTQLPIRAPWIPNPETLVNFYTNYPWLVWLVYLLLIGWLIGTNIWLLHPLRRQYYALSYQTNPPSSLPTCPQCGLILQQGLCPDHDKQNIAARLKANHKTYPLFFAQDNPIRTVGRHHSHKSATIILSTKDVSHPERISSKHISIFHDFSKKKFYIEDSSTNGTYLNGVKLRRNQRLELPNQAKIMLADQIELLFEY